MKPSVGRIVHYVSYGTPGGEYDTEHRAAIITRVCSDTYVDLCVMNPTGLFFNTSVMHEEPYEPLKYRGGTWHWPERVDD